MQEEHVETGDEKVGRRRVLRGVGAVLAGTAGAAVAGAVVAEPAQAAPGDPVLLGASNDAGTTITAVTNNNLTGSTVKLTNTALSAPDPATGLVDAGPALQLVPRGDFLAVDAPVGSITMTTDGRIWLTSAESTTEKFQDYVYTTGTASMTVPIKPIRVFDTRFSNTRGRILNPAGNLDSSGRLIGLHTINIDLHDFSFFSFGVFVNLAAIFPTRDGFLSLLPSNPTGAIPGTSNLNYTTSLVVLANYASTATSHFVDSSGVLHDMVSVFASETTHVFMDLMALEVPAPEFVNPSLLRAGGGQSTSIGGVGSRTSVTNRQVKAPDWFKGRTD
jgi:hypothetical protein